MDEQKVQMALDEAEASVSQEERGAWTAVTTAVNKLGDVAMSALALIKGREKDAEPDGDEDGGKAEGDHKEPDGDEAEGDDDDEEQDEGDEEESEESEADGAEAKVAGAPEASPSPVELAPAKPVVLSTQPRRRRVV